LRGGELVFQLVERAKHSGKRPPAAVVAGIPPDVAPPVFAASAITCFISFICASNGLRGETQSVNKMKAHIDHDLDLDYLRNWSLRLDLL
jgi:hypothetical protein